MPRPAPGVRAPRRPAPPLRVLMIASEAAPFSKTGGLADVASALPRALGRLGHEVTLFTPRYAGVSAGQWRHDVSAAVGGRLLRRRAVRGAARCRGAGDARRVPAALPPRRALQQRRGRVRRQRAALRVPGDRRAGVGGAAADAHRRRPRARLAGRPGAGLSAPALRAACRWAPCRRCSPSTTWPTRAWSTSRGCRGSGWAGTSSPSTAWSSGTASACSRPA